MSIRDTDTTTTNPYEGVLPLWAYKVSLAYAKRLGYRQDQIDDALQEIAIKYSAFRFDHTRDTGASERTAQIALIRNTLLQIRRNQIRYAQRLEQMQAEPRQPEAGPDTVAQHELWQVVQALMTGERIVRRRQSGREVVYHYYRCANNDPPSGHPVVRWPAEKLDDAVVAELEALRIHDEAHANLIRNTLKAAFADVAKLDADRRRVLAKLRSETKGRLDRLMNVFLDGAIEQVEFSARQGQLRAELADIDRQLEEQPRYDSKRGDLALTVFDFMQNAADLWKRSKPALRREILAAVSLNRRVSDVSLVLEKRKPFDVAIEGPSFHFGRVDCLEFKPTEIVNAVVNPFLGLPEPHLLRLPALLGAA